MDLNITHLLHRDLWNYAGSVVTHGKDVGPLTFNTAKHDATDILGHLVDADSVRAYLATMDAEWATLSDTEAYATLLQDIVLTLREAELDELIPDQLREYDWAWYDCMVNDGVLSGNIFYNDGKLYFYMGS